MNRTASDEEIIEKVKEGSVNYSEYEFKLDFPNAPKPFSYYQRMAGASLKKEANKIFQRTRNTFFLTIWIFILFNALGIYAVFYYWGRVVEGIPFFVMFLIFDILCGIAVYRLKKERDIDKMFQEKDALPARLKVRGKEFTPLKKKVKDSDILESTPVSFVILFTLGFSIISAILIFIGKWLNPPAWVIVAIIACFLVGGLLIYARAG